MEGGANPSSRLRFPLLHTVGAQGSSLLLSIVSMQENQMMLCLANLEEMTIKGEMKFLCYCKLLYTLVLASQMSLEGISSLLGSHGPSGTEGSQSCPIPCW